MALNMCFFAYESEKREAEAFAMSTAALVLGGMALVGVGGVILTRGNAETLGQNIINNIESAGQKVEDFFSYNAVSEIGKVTMGAVLKSYFNSAIGNMKANAVSTEDTYKLDSTSYTTLGRTYQTGIKFKLGDTIRYTVSYSNTSTINYVMLISAGTNGRGVASKSSYAFEPGSSSISQSVTVTHTQNSDRINLIISTPAVTDGVLTIHSIKIDNVTTQGTDEYKKQAQYTPISSDYSERAATLDSNLTKSVYEVSPNNITENVSTVDQIEQIAPPVEDTTSGTNTLIQRMITALANIPTAIKAEMSDLWADAGAIWSGMGDTLTNIKTDMGVKIGAMSDTMSGGIDNIRTDIGTTMENLRAGIDSVATSAAANMASWGQLTLDGIDAGIGTISTGLTNVWTNTTTAIETAATATTTAINTGIGTITDGLTTITDWVIGFPAMFFSWFVPPDFSFLGPLITKATNDLEDKFGTLPSLADLGSAITIQEKSIYDIEITLMGKNYKIVPIALKPTIDRARPFLTAAVNLTSITFLIHRNKRELFK